MVQPDTGKSFYDLRVDAEFLNNESEDNGLPAPIPDYSSMRKDDLAEALEPHQERIDEYLEDYGFYKEVK